MNQQSYIAPPRDSSWRVPYEPKPWIFWVRIAQIVCVFVTLVCAAYSAAKLLSGAPMSFFTIAWTIIYLPLVIWLFPRIQARYMPNVIVLVLESFCCIWWLSSFAIMAAWAAGSLTGYGAVTSLYRRSSYDDAIDDAIDAAIDSSSVAADYYNSWNSAYGALKAAAAFGAITWALLCVTLITVGIGFHKQRRAKEHQLRQTSGQPQQNNVGHGQAIETDKTYAQATVNHV